MERNTLRIKQGLLFGVSLTIIVIAAVITLFQHWELTNETWGYWVFARIFSETGHFIIPDRSPVYILYLQLFRWLPYPISVMTEYIVTTFILSFVLLLFFRPRLGIFIPTFAIILWLPYLQMSEPPVQKLAVAAICAAILVRSISALKDIRILSYVLVSIAWLLRTSLVVYFIPFLFGDVVSLLRKGKGKTIPRALVFTKNWYVYLFILFVLAVYLFQSQHPWNNIWFASTTWFASDGKGFTRSLQPYNETYIWQTYGTFEGYDFYASNKEAFGGAKDTIGAIAANPKFFRDTIPQYVYSGIGIIGNMTLLPKLFHISTEQRFLMLVIVGVLFAGCIAWWRHYGVRIYCLGSILVAGLTFTINPRARYFVFMIPVLLLSASGYGRMVLGDNQKLNTNQNAFPIMIGRVMATGSISILLYGLIFAQYFDRVNIPYLLLIFCAGIVCIVFARRIASVVPFRAGNLLGRGITTAVMLFFIILFSSGPTAVNYIDVYKNDLLSLSAVIRSDIQNNDLRMLDYRDIYYLSPQMTATFLRLTDIMKSCKGVMSLEYTFFGSFIDYPLDRLYDVWEIPPFGTYGQSQYQGLRPDRINCLFMSKALMYGVGGATNLQIRYRFFIEPYANFLKSQRARDYHIEGYGNVVVLE